MTKPGFADIPREVSSDCLSIVIPAYNEEEAIGDTLTACLAGIEQIQQQGRIAQVEVIVVSDGSQDHTEEIARSFADRGVQVIAYEKNRGYGAAIKTGFLAARGEYLGFMDADGTCSPAFFGQLIRLLKERQADIVLGSRLHASSKMPAIRRLGNRIYAVILSFLSRTRVHDSASGMRVLKRSCLAWLNLLPNGLHFTPAMSAMATTDSGMVIAEIPMPYEERQGESKLHVIRDGINFLNVIIGTAYSYIPARFFILSGLLMMLVGTLLVLPVLVFYFQNHLVDDQYIYPVMLAITLVCMGVSSALAGIIANNMVRLIEKRDFLKYGLVTRFMNRRIMPYLLYLSAAVFIMGFLFSWPGIATLLRTGRIELHWTRLLAGLMSIWIGLNLVFFDLLFRLQSLLRKRKLLLNEMA